MTNAIVVFTWQRLARAWSRNADDFYRVNVVGTENVFAVASEQKIPRVIFVSTASVFGPASAEKPVTESSPLAIELDSPYEKSKWECESLVTNYRKTGLNVLTVYPTRVLGPGELNPGNSLTSIISEFVAGRWRWIPGDGTSIGNYVFIDDVVDALSRVARYEAANRRFLIGGENLSFNQLASLLQRVTGRNRRMIHVPPWIIRLIARLAIIRSTWTGRPAFLTPAFVNKYLRDWNVDCQLAATELDDRPTPIADALQQTVAWIEQTKPYLNSSPRGHSGQ